MSGDEEMTLASFKQVTLDPLKVGIHERLSMEMASVADSVQLRWIVDHMTNSLVMELQAYVLAEQLPPQEVDHRMTVKFSEMRPATWWEMFKETYRGRWWMRWRAWRVRKAVQRYSFDRVVRVTVRDHWTYPRASVAMPPSLGSPVMVATWNVTDFGWRP